jgi:hypothetical protein
MLVSSLDLKTKANKKHRKPKQTKKNHRKAKATTKIDDNKGIKLTKFINIRMREK